MMRRVLSSRICRWGNKILSLFPHGRTASEGPRGDWNAGPVSLWPITWLRIHITKIKEWTHITDKTQLCQLQLDRDVDPHWDAILILTIYCLLVWVSTCPQGDKTDIWWQVVFSCWKLFSGKFCSLSFCINWASSGVCSFLSSQSKHRFIWCLQIVDLVLALEPPNVFSPTLAGFCFCVFSFF